MGANAQIAVPAFTAGQVLTATQQTQINTGIPVFATTTTRDAAFGGTGEKVLAEGQFAYIEATDTTQYYDGSSWIAVGATPGTKPITPTSVAVGSGSATINAGGSVTFTGASSVSLNGVFSSTYTSYQVVMTLTATSAEQVIGARLRASGSDTTSSTYKSSLLVFGQSSVTCSQTLTTSFTVNAPHPSYPYGSASIFYFFNPNLAQITAFQSYYQRMDPNNDNFGQIQSGNQNGTTQFDGFTLFVGGTFAGTVTVYGYSI